MESLFVRSLVTPSKPIIMTVMKNHKRMADKIKLEEQWPQRTQGYEWQTEAGQNR